MSRHHSNHHSYYGEDYDADYDDPRHHDNRTKSRYHLPDPAKHENKYKADHDGPRDPQYQNVTSHPEQHHSNNYKFSRSYPFSVLPPHEDGRRPRLPRPNLARGLPEKSWYTKAQIDAMGAENNPQPRRSAEGSEPIGRRAGEPTRTRTRVSRTVVAAPRAKLPWTPDEDAALIEYIRDGRDYFYIAEKLGRSKQSCGDHWRDRICFTPAAQGVKYYPRPS